MSTAFERFRTGASSSSSSSRKPALQPKTLGAKSARGAWDLTIDPGGSATSAKDYSGGGHNSLGLNIVTAPSRIAGKTCPMTWVHPSSALDSAAQGIPFGGSVAALYSLADVAFVGWCARSLIVPAPTQHQYIYGYGDQNNPAVAGNVSYSLRLKGGNISALQTYWESGPASDPVLTESSSALGDLLLDGLWHMVSCSRDDTAKTVTFGVDLNFEVVPYTVSPTDGTAGRPVLGRPVSSFGPAVPAGTAGLIGLMSNPVVWPALTQAELTTLYALTGGT